MEKAAATPAGAEREELLHDARKAAKQARYAGESVERVFGKGAEAFAEAMETVQEALGDQIPSVGEDMTAPANASKPVSQATNAKGRREGESGGGQGTDGEAMTEGFAEVAEARDDAAEHARVLAATDALARARDGGPVDEERAGRLRLSARQELLTELRSQEQQQAREQLARATRQGEEAVEGVIEGVAVVVRNVVPAALLRPEDVIEITYALADQGLRLTRRLALTVVRSLRSLTV